MVKTCLVDSHTDVSNSLFTILDNELSRGRNVLWLISGGSSLPIAAEVYVRVQSYCRKNLYISLVDDKYGSKNTNGKEFCRLVQVADKNCHISIIDPNVSFQRNISNFNNLIVGKLKWAEFCIGQFGLGEKCHTGGIWPLSKAAKSKALVCGYEREGVKHITITPSLIKKLDVAFINSLGPNKRELVEHFLISKAPIRTEPTQSLKTASQCVLYSDVVPN